MTIGKFFHRTNVDFTIGSICTRCFMTIATGNSHDDVIEAEAAHDCTPFILRKHWDSPTGTDAARCPQVVNQVGQLSLQ